MELNKKNRFKLVIPEEIRKIIEERHILLDDIEKVIEHSKISGERFFNSEDSSYLASLRIENVTYWVRYAEENDCIHVLSVYSHRMEIAEE